MAWSSSGRPADEVVPAANGSADLASDAARVEALGQHLADVRLQQLGDPNLGPDAAAETLQAEQDPEQQRQVGRQHEAMVVEQLHAAAHDPVHVELADADEQVAVEPRLDVGAELGEIDVGRWGRQLEDDVDERVDVVGPDGDDQRLELAAALAGEATDVTEVEDRHVVAVGEQEVPRMGIGVIEAVAEDHLQVDVGRPLHERRRRPSRRPRRWLGR